MRSEKQYIQVYVTIWLHIQNVYGGLLWEIKNIKSKSTLQFDCCIYKKLIHISTRIEEKSFGLSQAKLKIHVQVNDLYI